MRKFFFIATFAIFLLEGCNSVGTPKGHFSQKVTSVDEPQTDDERTLVGEFNDYLLLVDSLSAIWNGTDTLNMRRLMFEIEEQGDRVEKAMKFQNVRRSMCNQIDGEKDKIWEEIRQKFPKELRDEWHDFYFTLYYCHILWESHPNFPFRGEKVYQNTMGEHYVIRANRKVPVSVKEGKFERDYYAPY